MLLYRKLYQLTILVMPLVLMLCGCKDTDLKATTKQQQSLVSEASPAIPSQVAIAQDQDWVARHQDEDRIWAGRTSLTPKQIRQLRLIGDLPDDEAGYVDNVDTQNLKPRNQVLLVTAGGNGHCLELLVLERKGDDFQRVWSVNEMSSGAGFCRESPVNPEAYATLDGKLVVKIPVFDYRNNARATDFYTYVWNGKGYEFGGKSTDSDNK